MSEPYFQSSDVTIWNADARDAASLLATASVDAIVTSPPYFGLRDYGVDGQVGSEATVGSYVEGLADLLTSYVAVLKPDGSLWLNLGDTYAEKSLLMVPESVAFALRARGWILRNRVVWAKPNGMPASVRDRLATKHEALFHFVRQPRYHYDLDAIREPHTWVNDEGVPIDSWGRPRVVRHEHHKNAKAGESSKPGVPASLGCADGGKNPGDVWTIPTQPYPEAHFAVFPPELVRRPILATVPVGGTVLDPFFGSGTTALMARKLGRHAIGIELSPDYCALAAARFRQDVLPLDATA